ncbi:MAG: SAM-dependent chlorinase/fluorinase [Chloroflexi bacterium]|nr:SAM-dependent chlorinase/fluorinase [Chloroflexota bacterium]
MPNTIALLTDFGTRDIYVGAMKGVIQRTAPQTTVIDISHHIEAQNVRQAAFALLNAYRYFVEGTVFLIVVDPGVGSTRKPIAVQAGAYIFVAPDNGVLSYALADLPEMRAYELTNPSLWLPETSATFHGRDVFAPVAAYLSAGMALENVGDALESIFTLPPPQLSVSGKRVRGEIMHIDRFGNIISSIGQLRWLAPDKLTLDPRFGDSRVPVPVRATEARIKIDTTEIEGLSRAYADAPRGTLLALAGSNGYLEIAVNQGNAAATLDVVVGDHIDFTVGGA